MTPWARLLAVVALLAVAGCSEGDGAPAPPGEDGAQAEVRQGLASLFAGDHAGARERADGRCFAEALTATTSAARLQDAGVLDEEYDVVDELPVLPEEIALAWSDAQFQCTDFVAESTRAQVDVTKGSLDTDAYAACLRGSVTEQQLRAAVVDSLTGDWGGVDLARLGRAQSDCAAEATPRDPG